MIKLAGAESVRDSESWECCDRRETDRLLDGRLLFELEVLEVSLIIDCQDPT